MSRTLYITCDQCRQTLWVGQGSQTRGWYVYTAPSLADELNRFVNDHIGHSVRFEDSELVDDEFEDLTEYDRSSV